MKTLFARCIKKSSKAYLFLGSERAILQAIESEENTALIVLVKSLSHWARTYSRFDCWEGFFCFLILGFWDIILTHSNSAIRIQYNSSYRQFWSFGGSLNVSQIVKKISSHILGNNSLKPKGTALSVIKFIMSWRPLADMVNIIWSSSYLFSDEICKLISLAPPKDWQND